MSEKQYAGVKIWIDKDFLQSTKGAGELLTQFETNKITSIIEKLPVSNSLFWTRVDPGQVKSSASTENEIQHDHALVRVDWEFFLDGVADYLAGNGQILIDFLDNVKRSAQVTNVTLLMHNFKQNMKNFKSSDAKSAKSKTKLTKMDVNRVIVELELEQRVTVRSYETTSELKDLVLSYTKAVSEYATRCDSMDNMLFCEKSIEKSQTKVGKEGQGLINLWKDFIQTFPQVSSDQAQAICAVYPSPLLLKKAYDECEKSDGPMLLADIQVRRGAGVLSSVRRIGPELSQKIYKFFTSTKSNELLVNN